ncbi:MAG: hypothetical protein VX466_03975 [Myxococcota bacterium]|nr:hypothetical protein [Myxococcota bacterium]
MTIRRSLALLLACSLIAGPAAAQLAALQPVCVDPAADVDPRRSLFVTELDVVQQAFSLEEVLAKLASDSGIPGLRPDDLWEQWWDTENLAPGLGLGPNCDDVVDPQGNATINGFPIQCPRNEGAEINVDPFTPGLASFYEPIALVNRFDLAPVDGANCGEYRVIFARHSGATNPFQRNLVIFEAVLPNPEPSCGLEGCRTVARFWENLSRIDDPARRASLLRRFYLEGFPGRGIAPVIQAEHFGPGNGQIRTNQFTSGPAPQLWQLREFKLAHLCEAEDGPCQLQFTPVTVKGNPFGELFGSTSPDRRTRRFKRHYLTQVENLSAPDLNQFFAVVPDRFNAGQSNSSGIENDYPVHFAGSPRFERALEHRLRRLGIDLEPVQLVRRSLALSCAGCHQLSNFAPENDLGGMQWPASLGFVHVSEAQTETLDGGEHFVISPALQDVFIPHREEVFEAYLDGGACTECESLALETGGSPAPVMVPLTLDEGTPIGLVSEQVRALDAELKAGRSDETVGGPRPVH